MNATNLKKVSELQPGLENVNIRVRVLEVNEPKVITTRSGQRTISEAVVGDETGRVRLTLWGNAVGKIEEGSVVEIHGAWTTVYRGEIVLNVSGRGEILTLTDNDMVSEENIPAGTPKAPATPKPQQRGFKGSRSYRPRKPRSSREREY